MCLNCALFFQKTKHVVSCSKKQSMFPLSHQLQILEDKRYYFPKLKENLCDFDYYDLSAEQNVILNLTLCLKSVTGDGMPIGQIACDGMCPSVSNFEQIIGYVSHNSVPLVIQKKNLLYSQTLNKIYYLCQYYVCFLYKMC